MSHPYSDLHRILKNAPSDSIREFLEAGRKGDSGFGFTPDLRWSLTEPAGSKSTRLIIKDSDGFNADDFNPDAIIEGTLIAAYLLGAERAFIDVGGKVETTEPLLEKSVVVAKTAKLAGENILGTDHSVEISVNPRGKQNGKGTETGYNIRFQIKNGPRASALVSTPIVAPIVVVPAPAPAAAPAPAPVVVKEVPKPKEKAPEAIVIEKAAPPAVIAVNRETAPSLKNESHLKLSLFLRAFAITLLLICIYAGVTEKTSGVILLAGTFLSALSFVAGHMAAKSEQRAEREERAAHDAKQG